MIDYSELFQQEVKLSLGCTEPVAVGYAVSVAYHSILGQIPSWLVDRVQSESPFKVERSEVEIEKIEVLVDRDIYKNALAVGIPRSGGQRGIVIAAAMGVFCLPSTQGMEMGLFSDIGTSDLERAREIVDKVTIDLVDGWHHHDGIDIQANVTVQVIKQPDLVLVGRARIQSNHNNVTEISVIQVSESQVNNPSSTLRQELALQSIKDLVQDLATLSPQELNKMKEMLKTNLLAAKTGLKSHGQLAIGHALKQLVESGYLRDDAISLGQILVAAAADARMSGFDCSVMSSAGSGNQGITATLPLVAVAMKNGYDVERLMDVDVSGELSDPEVGKLHRLLESLALSNIITSFVTYHSSYLSAMCGCTVKAGIGATAGIAYLLSENAKIVDSAIKNMAGNITGIICDGAKEGCALKLTTAASVAILSAFLALQGIEVHSDNGIVAETAEETIRNIGRICKAMIETDVEIVQIMNEKLQNLS